MGSVSRDRVIGIVFRDRLFGIVSRQLFPYLFAVFFLLCSGTGPEKVILIHGICMSSYFFADVIRALFPEAEERGGGPLGGPLEGPMGGPLEGPFGGPLGGPRGDPHEEGDAYERKRYTFYCVDLLGYGKSAAIPSAHNYSRREQASPVSVFFLSLSL